MKLKGDLYKPSGRGPFPALILVHGGGWIYGSKDQWKIWGPYLANIGIASFAISYRLAEKNHPVYPRNIWDVKSAIQFIRGKAPDLGIDAKRIGGMGSSAGAHLVSMMVLAGDNPAFDSPYRDEPWHSKSAKLEVAIVVSGIYDLIAQWEHDQIHRPYEHYTERFLGGNPMDNRERFYQASPVYHASLQNASETKWLVGWGTADNFVDFERQSIPFVTHLSRANAMTRVAELAGADHFWWNFSPVTSDHSRVFAEKIPDFLFSRVGW